MIVAGVARHDGGSPKRRTRSTGVPGTGPKILSCNDYGRHIRSRTTPRNTGSAHPRETSTIFSYRYRASPFLYSFAISRRAIITTAVRGLATPFKCFLACILVFRAVGRGERTEIGLDSEKRSNRERVSWISSGLAWGCSRGRWLGVVDFIGTRTGSEVGSFEGWPGTIRTRLL